MKSPWHSSIVPEHAAGLTLEQFLRQELGVSGRMLQRLTRIRGIRWNREETFLQRKVKSGDQVAIKLKPRAAAPPRSTGMRAEILWQDRRALVVNKPAGLASHAEGKGTAITLIDVLREQLTRGDHTPGVHLVHRLDRPTSGTLLVAKDSLAHAQLDAELRTGTIERSYLARVAGTLSEAEFTIDAPIKRDVTHATRRCVDAKGQSASSRIKQLAYDAATDTTLVQLWPITGRTHQLRVHLQHLGHPILGDRLYGGRTHERLLLHAWQLSFSVPWRDGERIAVTATPPPALSVPETPSDSPPAPGDAPKLT